MSSYTSCDPFSKIFEPIVIIKEEDPFRRFSYQAIVADACFTPIDGSSIQVPMRNTMLYYARGGFVRRVFEPTSSDIGIFAIYPYVNSVAEAMSVLSRCGATRKQGLFVDTHTTLYMYVRLNAFGGISTFASVIANLGRVEMSQERIFSQGEEVLALAAD